MTPSVQTDFLTVVRERHAVKQYDPSFKLSRNEIKQLLETAASAPSAWNLQHWKFMAIDDQAAKEKLLPIAYGQRQIVDSSVVIAILGDLEAHRNAEAVFGPSVEAGQLPLQVKENLIGQINYVYANVPTAPRDEAIRNASLAAMQLMLAARAQGLDSCPMGGYDSSKFVEEFGVPSRYVPVMLISIGKAASPARPSMRLPIEDAIVWNNF